MAEGRGWICGTFREFGIRSAARRIDRFFSDIQLKILVDIFDNYNGDGLDEENLSRIAEKYGCSVEITQALISEAIKMGPLVAFHSFSFLEDQQE